jgi:hypothetical protein
MAQALNMAAPAPTKSCASAIRLNLLAGIAVSFDEIFCGLASCPPALHLRGVQ